MGDGKLVGSFPRLPCLLLLLLPTSGFQPSPLLHLPAAKTAHSFSILGSEYLRTGDFEHLKVTSEEKGTQFRAWRVSNIHIPWREDVGKDATILTLGLVGEVARSLNVTESLFMTKDEEGNDEVDNCRLRVVRKSFDARPNRKIGRCWNYVVDVLLPPAVSRRLRTRPGILEPADALIQEELRCLHSVGTEPHSLFTPTAKETEGAKPKEENTDPGPLEHEDIQGTHPPIASEKPPVIIIGSGPAGLLCALTLALAGLRVTVVERGRPVERRGKDIGKLMNRRALHPDSNFCFGEGGAGTWSDGKLSTRIGRGSGEVRAILEILVEMGAPLRILTDGRPHLGTDKLVRLLKNLRGRLEALGVKFVFDTKVVDLHVKQGKLEGIVAEPSTEEAPLPPPSGSWSPSDSFSSGDLLSPRTSPEGSIVLEAPLVVLAAGGSARDLYVNVVEGGLHVSNANFAVGLRVEHPQKVVDCLAFGEELAEEVRAGKGVIPVADYSLVHKRAKGAQLQMRGTRTFCMCPGGQVVPTSLNPYELCINGMSFSKRSSQWANAAVVANVLESDYQSLTPKYGPLAATALQRMIEREAAKRGGFSLKAPVQRVRDYLEGRVAPSREDLPSSSYRLGTVSAGLHDIFPSEGLNTALRRAMEAWDSNEFKGNFVSDQALLHGVETRCSSPLRVPRSPQTLQSLNLPGLYPCGEGAGFAGGIVSAAVDGFRVASAIVRDLSSSPAFGGEKSTPGGQSSSKRKSSASSPAEQMQQWQGQRVEVAKRPEEMR